MERKGIERKEVKNHARHMCYMGVERGNGVGWYRVFGALRTGPSLAFGPYGAAFLSF